MDNWQKEMTATIGRRVKELRGDRTAVWLSERTEQLGMKISRSAISELEGGKRRSISVAEWLTLAAALDVPPALLLFPRYPYGEAEPLPGVETTALKAVDWVAGRRLLVEAPTPSIEPFPNRLVDLADQQEGLVDAWIQSVREGHASGQRDLEAEVLERRGVLNRAIIEAGGVGFDGEG